MKEETEEVEQDEQEIEEYCPRAWEFELAISKPPTHARIIRWNEQDERA